MRNTVPTLIALSVMATVGALPAAAGDAAWCIKGCDYGSGLGDCSFATYQQCQATASGRLASCAANPYFIRSADLSPSAVSRRRH
jgi:Protein of unknown function (DUF3551)